MNHEEKVSAIVERLGDKNLVRIKEKTDEQLDYVLSSINKNILLKACPGSGKTEVVGLKGAYEIQKWNRKPSGIAILTFTNNATDVIKERVTQFIGNDKASYPHFIGTIDSWLHKYIAQPFGYLITKQNPINGDHSYRLVNDTESGNWLYSFQLKTRYYFLKKDGTLNSLPIFPNMLRFNILTNKWEIKNQLSETNEYIQMEDFYNSEAFTVFRKDKSWLTIDFIKKSFIGAKKSFYEKGFATYSDIEFICCLLLSHKNNCETISKRFPVILIDECQDLSYEQLEIFNNLNNHGTLIHLIGDLKQSIYEFKKVDPEQVENFITNKIFITKSLKDNFRSCQMIVDVCAKIVNGEKINGREKNILEPACIYFTYKKNGISSLVNEFEKYLLYKGIPVNKSVIITRSWKNVYRLRNINNDEKDKPQYQIAMAIYLWQKKERVSMEEAIRLLGKFISKKYFNDYSANSRQYYCPECVKSAINWRIFLANILNAIYKSEGSIKNQNQIWSNWSKTIKSELMTITKNCIAILNESVSLDVIKKIDLNECKFQAPKGEAANNVLNSLIISETTSIEVLITTIHSVKGQTFDAVLVVSSPSKVGTSDGHWSDWLENPKSEAARLAYVASSRPKYLLAWAIPEPNEEEIKKLESIGFKSFNN